LYNKLLILYVTKLFIPKFIFNLFKVIDVLPFSQVNII